MNIVHNKRYSFRPVQGFCWNIWWLEACLRNKFSHCLCTGSVSTLHVECRFSSPPPWPSNSMCCLEFDCYRLFWHLFLGSFDNSDIGNNFNEEQKNHLLSFTLFLKEKEWIYFVVDRVKLPMTVNNIKEEEVEVLMPIREIGLSWVDPVPRNTLTHYKSI